MFVLIGVVDCSLMFVFFFRSIVLKVLLFECRKVSRLELLNLRFGLEIVIVLFVMILIISIFCLVSVLINFLRKWCCFCKCLLFWLGVMIMSGW